MGGDHDDDDSSGIPAWQRNEANDSSTTGDKPDSQPDQLEVARRFLQEDEVKSSSRSKKVEFLKSKGISDADIETLLGASENEQQMGGEKADSHSSAPVKSSSDDRPPIVTYPEFLVKPERPPPLVTTNRLLNTMYTFAGLSTLLYGTSKYLIEPMVESLTDARCDLHKLTADKLDGLVAQMEKTVSVVPPTKSQSGQPLYTDDDASSDAEDPSEMFHRDVGTQTSPMESRPLSGADKAAESAVESQSGQLSALSKSLSVLRDQCRTHSEEFEQIKTLLDVFRDDLDGMTYTGSSFVGGFDVYGGTKKNEPEDEIRKVRDNIRRVKGVLLSTRNFPSSTR